MCLDQTNCLDLIMNMLLLPLSRAPKGFLDGICRLLLLPLLPSPGAQIQDLLSHLEASKACLNMRGCPFL